MKYCVLNQLHIFDFHDSSFSLLSFDGKDLVVSARAVNIRKNTRENPSESDMEIDSAQITFRNFRSAAYEPGRTWKTGPDGKSHPVGPRVIHTGPEGLKIILEELRNGISVYHFEKEENGRYSIGGCGIEPYFIMEFVFDDILVSWDTYRQKAWYELHRQYRYDALLHTPGGDEEVQLIVTCHQAPVYVGGILQQPPTVNAGCKYDGQEYWCHGTNVLWSDAIEDLQRRLPTGVFLKGCLTCAQGVFCSTLTPENRIFCTKDDTDPAVEAEQEKQSMPFCGLCADYRPRP